MVPPLEIIRPDDLGGAISFLLEFLQVQNGAAGRGYWTCLVGRQDQYAVLEQLPRDVPFFRLMNVDSQQGS